jgi:hypothetical protein
MCVCVCIYVYMYVSLYASFLPSLISVLP